MCTQYIELSKIIILSTTFLVQREFVVFGLHVIYINKTQPFYSFRFKSGKPDT